MSRTRIIFDTEGKLAEYKDDKLVWCREELSAADTPHYQLLRDIEPYQSMVTGQMITSRSQHREHLRRHDVIEIGNEKMESRPVQVKNNRRELLHRRLADMSDKQANQILKELRRN